MLVKKGIIVIGAKQANARRVAMRDRGPGLRQGQIDLARWWAFQSQVAMRRALANGGMSGSRQRKVKDGGGSAVMKGLGRREGRKWKWKWKWKGKIVTIVRLWSIDTCRVYNATIAFVACGRQAGSQGRRYQLRIGGMRASTELVRHRMQGWRNKRSACICSQASQASQAIQYTLTLQSNIFQYALCARALLAHE
jgi:hypothetical protein